MRILQSIRTLDPVGGGAIEAVLQSSRALAPLGHEVEILCLDEPDSPWLKNSNVPTYALGPGRTPYRVSLRHTAWLRENLRNYDAVILNDVWQHTNFSAALVARETHVPYFVYPHGSLDRTLHGVFPVRRFKKMAMWMLAERRVLEHASAVFYTTQFEKELAEKAFWPYLPNDNGVVLPYCVGEPPEGHEDQMRAFRKAFPHLANNRFCLFLSRVHPKKGCELLIDAFAKIVRAQPDLQLVIAGPQSPSYTRNLKRMAAKRGIENKITWAGMLTGDLKWGALRSAEVFVLPTRHENFGIAIVEALSCSSPVLISDKTNIAPIIKRHSAGIVGTDSAPSTLEGLKKWFSLPAVAQDEMRQSARRCFNESFSALENAQLLIRSLTGELDEFASARVAPSEVYRATFALES